MKSKINIKELCKLIRQGRTSGALIWSREATQHFISNRHWLARFDELPRDVMIALFSVFCKIPEVGQTVNVFAGQEGKGNPIKYDSIYQPDKQDMVGEATLFMKDLGRKEFVRVIKFPSHFAFINEGYFKLAEDPTDIKTQGNPNFPIYLAGGDLLILPIRRNDNGDDATIKMLLEDDENERDSIQKATS